MSLHLHLDPIGGLAGDMWLGLLLDLGLPLPELQALVARLELHDVTLQAARTTRCELAATKASVSVRGSEESPAAAFGPQQPLDAAHHHDDDHGHGHDHDHGHDHGHTHAPDRPHGRSLTAMLAVVDRARLNPPADRLARRTIQLLFEAEALAHGLPIDAVHLHEAGADDALVDILGTAFGLDRLAIGSISCSVPLSVGGGQVRCAHGVMPVPVPAVAQLLHGVPLVGGPIARELITPTGAALLRAVEPRFAAAPAMTLLRTGHGAGSRDEPPLPNLLRGLLGTPVAGPLERSVAVLETALDDLSPQDVPVLIERLLAAGARDAYVLDVRMKKGRPGWLLTVIADPDQARRLAELVLTQSPALGIRWREERRLEWDRDLVVVQTPWGPVRIKRALDSAGGVRRGRAEFEDCRALADAAGVAPDEVRRQAERQFEAGEQPPGRDRG